MGRFDRVFSGVDSGLDGVCLFCLGWARVLGVSKDLGSAGSQPQHFRDTSRSLLFPKGLGFKALGFRV